MGKRRLVVLSTSGLTMRILSASGSLSHMEPHCEAHVWSTSQEMMAKGGSALGLELAASFPEVFALREFPDNIARRMNELAWDFALENPSRLSMMRHLRDRSWPWYIKLLKPIAKSIATLGLHPELESALMRRMARIERSPEATRRLLETPPDLIVSTGPHRYEEPPIVASAFRLGIPVIAFITSFDNISIKGRLINDYDGYLVWSPAMKEELLRFYPHARKVPVHIVGAPQFDVFRDTRYSLNRQEFCARWALDPHRSFIVAAMGVANNIDETHFALDLARRVCAGHLGDVQLLVRPHPFLHGRTIRDQFSGFGPRVVVQFDDAQAAVDRRQRSLDHEGVLDWVNTFRHAAVVVHLSSSVAIDAALCQTPSVCLDYDPTPGQPNQELVHDVNHKWLHYKPIIESGGTWLAATPEELVKAIRAYLDDRSLHAEERKRMAELVCGYTDGQCARRMAEAILSFLPTSSSPGTAPELLHERN